MKRIFSARSIKYWYTRSREKNPLEYSTQKFTSKICWWFCKGVYSDRRCCKKRRIRFIYFLGGGDRRGRYRKSSGSLDFFFLWAECRWKMCNWQGKCWSRIDGKYSLFTSWESLAREMESVRLIQFSVFFRRRTVGRIFPLYWPSFAFFSSSFFFWWKKTGVIFFLLWKTHANQRGVWKQEK